MLMNSACHPEVGDVLIRDDGWEATLSIGRFGHEHFSDYRQDIAESEKAQAIAEDVLVFFGMLLSDQVLL
jgi:hypothetical protein